MKTVKKVLITVAIVLLAAAAAPTALIPFSREVRYRRAVSFMDSARFKSERAANSKADFENIPELTSDPEYQVYNLLKVAFSQLGYQEGSLDGHGFKPDSPLPTSEYEGGLTKYGLWYADNYSTGIGATWYSQGHWCSMFISWCAMTAGIPTETLIWHADCDEAMAWFRKRGQLKWSESWSFMNDDWDFVDPPEVGDIAMFSAYQTDRDITHVGIVYKVENGIVYTIEGNTEDSCNVRERLLSDPTIIAYGHPDYKTPAFPSVEDMGSIRVKPCIIGAACALAAGAALLIVGLTRKRGKSVSQS